MCANKTAQYWLIAYRHVAITILSVPITVVLSSTNIDVWHCWPVYVSMLELINCYRCSCTKAWASVDYIVYSFVCANMPLLNSIVPCVDSVVVDSIIDTHYMKITSNLEVFSQYMTVCKRVIGEINCWLIMSDLICNFPHSIFKALMLYSLNQRQLRILYA